MAERADVEAALAAGAEAVVVGTRFLLSDESDAHPEYKRRLLEARRHRAHRAVRRRLAGASPGRAQRGHRALAARGDRGPGWVRGLHRVTAPALSRMPVAMIQRAARAQRPGMPMLGPAAATIDDPESLLDSGPLYAGQCVARIQGVLPAAEIVRALSPSSGGRESA